jgi:hypothetical protein
VSVALCPAVMVVGATVSCAVAAGLLDPPPPPQAASPLASADNATSLDRFDANALSLSMTLVPSC